MYLRNTRANTEASKKIKMGRGILIAAAVLVVIALAITLFIYELLVENLLVEGILLLVLVPTLIVLIVMIFKLSNKLRTVDVGEEVKGNIAMCDCGYFFDIKELQYNISKVSTDFTEGFRSDKMTSSGRVLVQCTCPKCGKTYVDDAGEIFLGGTKSSTVLGTDTTRDTTISGDEHKAPDMVSSLFAKRKREITMRLEELENLGYVRDEGAKPIDKKAYYTVALINCGENKQAIAEKLKHLSLFTRPSSFEAEQIISENRQYVLERNLHFQEAQQLAEEYNALGAQTELREQNGYVS